MRGNEESLAIPPDPGMIEELATRLDTEAANQATPLR